MANNIFELARGLPSWMILGIGVITGSLRTIWSFIYERTIGYAMARISLSLKVEAGEHREAYFWLNYWVEKNLRNRRINSVLLRRYDEGDNRNSNEALRFQLIPEYGTYYMKYKKRLMVVEHCKETQFNTTQLRTTHYIRLQIWLSWKRDIILDILNEARAAYEEAQPFRVEYFQAGQYGDWNGTFVPARSLASIYHPEFLIRELIEDTEMFLDSKDLYADLGIPYRRGYLLAGPPGTGKSSLILAISSHFKLPIYSVPLRGPGITGDRLSQLLLTCRRPSVIVLEDVDCLAVATSRESKSEEGITIADLLNVIDGIGACEDRVLFMTSNHPEVLDPALIRPGRVDRKFYIGYARDEELQSFHTRIARYHSVQPWPDFRNSLPENATIADAQAIAFQGRNSSQRVASDQCGPDCYAQKAK